MMRFVRGILPVFFVVATVSVLAHGVAIDLVYGDDGSITVTAAFDTGEVLDEAQVAVFAPSNMVEPWLTGTTDADGVFSFTPDFTDEGEWSVQIRKAGHGGLVSTRISADMAAEIVTSNGASRLTDTQTAVLSVLIIVGMVGGAFYYTGRRRPASKLQSEGKGA